MLLHVHREGDRPVGAPMPKEMREHGKNTPTINSSVPHPISRCSLASLAGRVSPRWIISRVCVGMASVSQDRSKQFEVYRIELKAIGWQVSARR